MRTIQNKELVSELVVSKIEALHSLGPCSSTIKEVLISSYRRCSETDLKNTFIRKDSALTVTTPLMRALKIEIELNNDLLEARPQGK